ncbi:MAG: L,D-transpeptidase [Solirubrobacteraceae bacterium]
MQRPSVSRLPRSAGLLFALLAALVLWLVPAATAQSGATVSPAPTTTTPGTPGVQQLSDERLNTYWAHSAGDALVHYIPTVTGRQVGRLHLLTEDGAAEVYIVLRRYVDGAGRTWLRIRLPKRPNGSTGWVLARGLGPVHRISTHLVIDRLHLAAALFDGGRLVWNSPVGVGKASTPTPRGNFWIREKLVALGGSNPIYGPYALGTSAYSILTDWPGGGVVGIHGTNQPELIPGRPSHGCVRVPNPAIIRLYRLIPVGTPVTIL